MHAPDEEKMAFTLKMSTSATGSCPLAWKMQALHTRDWWTKSLNSWSDKMLSSASTTCSSNPIAYPNTWQFWKRDSEKSANTTYASTWKNALSGSMEASSSASWSQVEEEKPIPTNAQLYWRCAVLPISRKSKSWMVDWHPCLGFSQSSLKRLSRSTNCSRKLSHSCGTRSANKLS